MATRKRSVLIAAAALLGLAVAGGYYWYDKYKEVPPPKQSAIAARPVATTVLPPVAVAVVVVPPPAAVVPVAQPKPQAKAKPRGTLKPVSKPKASVPQAGTHAWQHWNAAPYAASQEEACRKASEAIDGFTMPPVVKEHFKSSVGVTCKGGTETWLVPHEALEQMWSGGVKPHVMSNVTVAELPVLQSPDGRPYRKGAVAETAKALSWEFVYEGKTYVLYLPYVCYNWSWDIGSARKSEQCLTVTIHPKVGDHIIAVAFTKDYLPPSACFKLIQGNRTTSLPAPCTTCDWSGFKGLSSTGNKPFLVTSFIAESETVTLSYPIELKQGDFGLCDTRGGTQSNGHFTKQEQWGTPTAYNVSPEIWPTWDRSQIGRVIK